MKNIYSALILAVTASFAFSACAQTKKSSTLATGSSYVKVIEASRQRILPGAPGMEPTDEYRMVIVWKSTQKPESFFWRGADGWLPCNVAKATKNGNAKENGGTWYNVKPLSIEKIKKGDTLELLPIAGGKYPIPSQIPPTAVNTLFFKTTKKASWLSVPVDVKKREDIIMQ